MADNKGPAGLKGSFVWRISLPLLLVLMAAGVAGLRDVQVTVPEAAAAGDTVALQCRYDLETDALYSVKWYKGRQEFFRYIPKELPHTRVFALDGVDVDVGRSGPATVVLRGVLPSLSGRYRCEVSADAPSFHTAMKTSFMHVVELPESAPVIFSEKVRVSVGDMLKVRCTAPPAHPPANLTWILNGKTVKGVPIVLDDDETKPVKGSFFDESIKHRSRRALNKMADIRSSEDNYNPYEQDGFRTQWKKVPNGQPTRSYDSDVESITSRSKTERQGNEVGTRTEEEIVKRRSGSKLIIPITQDVFQQGQLSLVCKATVFSLYSADARLTLDEDKPQIALILGNKQNPNNGAVSIFKHTTTAFIVFALLLKYLTS